MFAYATYRGLYILGESVFFDKLFYQKSVAHGYWMSETVALEDFGKRSADLIALEQTKENDPRDQTPQVLGVADEANRPFVIAMIGDSVVWGTGVHFSDSLSQVLERKLNRIRNTRVLTLGRGGDSALDYLFRYRQASSHSPIDLYIFILVNNDAMLRHAYQDQVQTEPILSYCEQSSSQPLLFEPDWREIPIAQQNSMLNSLFVDSWENQANLCVLEKSFEQLPKENTFYLLAGDYQFSPQWEQYRLILERLGLPIISSTLGRELPDYQWYFREENQDKLSVSPLEDHPSKVAHAIFADLLYQKILQMQDFKNGAQSTQENNEAHKLL
jgi:hypothetical protein